MVGINMAAGAVMIMFRDAVIFVVIIMVIIIQREQ